MIILAQMNMDPTFVNQILQQFSGMQGASGQNPPQTTGDGGNTGEVGGNTGGVGGNTGGGNTGGVGVGGIGGMPPLGMNMDI
jgi:hypothetical protein